MSTPIHFKGTDYDSLEAMPASVRQAYEQAQRDAAGHQPGARHAGHGQPDDEDDDDDDDDDEDQDDETLTPAWGGAGQPGSLPVPAGFEQVTGLGPVTAVHEHKGIQLLPKLGPPRASRLVCYHDGFAFQAGGKEVHAWHYGEVGVIQSSLTHHSEKDTAWTDHLYTLTRSSGEKLILDDEIKDVWGAAEAIKKAVFALSGPSYVQRYQAGESMTFGPVTVQRQNGLALEGQTFAWGTIQNVTVKNGEFLVTLSGGKKHTAPVAAIPNVELLCRVIGLKLDWEELQHRSWW